MVRLRHARRDPYNLILVDWKMPEMDGVETTRAIRDIVGNESAIIILTAYRWDDVLEEALGVHYTKEQAEAASAIRRVTPSAPPHLILQGLDDVVVSPSQSRNYYEALREAGVTAELLELEDAQHGDDLFFQDEVKDRVIRFLQKELK